MPVEIGSRRITVNWAGVAALLGTVTVFGFFYAVGWLIVYFDKASVSPTYPLMWHGSVFVLGVFTVIVVGILTFLVGYALYLILSIILDIEEVR